MVYDSDQCNDTIIDTKLMARCSLFKKLLISTPSSGQSHVSIYLGMVSGDLMIPSSVATIIDNFGKTDDNDMVIRIKDNVYNIHTLALDSSKTYLEHSYNRWEYTDIQCNSFSDYKPEFIHFVDYSSTRKLRELAQTYLDQVYELEFTLDVGNLNFTVDYSKLQISTDSEIMRDNYVAWTNKLSPLYTDIEESLMLVYLLYPKIVGLPKLTLIPG